jgi:hypothetical protein
MKPWGSQARSPVFLTFFFSRSPLSWGEGVSGRKEISPLPRDSSRRSWALGQLLTPSGCTRLFGLLGRTYDPFFILKDPNEDSFDVPELSPDPELSPTRLEARRSLLLQLDDAAVASNRTDDFQSFRQRAHDLLSSPDVRRAFRISEEPDATREASRRFTIA